MAKPGDAMSALSVFTDKGLLCHNRVPKGSLASVWRGQSGQSGARASLVQSGAVASLANLAFLFASLANLVER